MYKHEAVTDIVARRYSEGERRRWGMEHYELTAPLLLGSVATQEHVNLETAFTTLAPVVVDLDRTELRLMIANQAEERAHQS